MTGFAFADMSSHLCCAAVSYAMDSAELLIRKRPVSNHGKKSFEYSLNGDVFCVSHFFSSSSMFFSEEDPKDS